VRRWGTLLLLIVVVLLAALSGAVAQNWADFATVSMTNATTPKLTANRLCYTDGTDMVCDGAAGLLLTSGTLQITNISATNVSATGNVSALKFIGDGSSLTGISTQGDRITSGTATVIANSTGGYISLTTGATTWGYLGSSATFIPLLNGNTVSSTQIGATNISQTVSEFLPGTFTSLAGGGGNYIVSGTSSVSTSSAGRITFVTGGTQRAMIDSSGRLGIGTAAPSSTLHIMGASSAEGTVLISAGSGNSTDSVFRVLGDTSPVVERFSILRSGNVGIGTASPATLLDVNGVITAAPTGINLKRSSDSVFAGQLYSPASSADFLFINNGGSTASLRLNSTGSAVVSAGANSCTYSSGASWSCSSDERLKTEIHPIKDALDKLALINGVSYHWRAADKAKGEHLGVIAQDIEKVFPQVVSRDNRGYRAVDYSALVAPLIEAVKELKADNDNLRANIDTLNERLNKIEVIRR
jgi:hypothetical protein